MFQRMLSQYEFGSTLFIKSPQIDFCEKKKIVLVLYIISSIKEVFKWQVKKKSCSCFIHVLYPCYG